MQGDVIDNHSSSYSICLLESDGLRVGDLRLLLNQGLRSLLGLRIRGFPKKISMIRIMVCWDLYWGPHILGNYHFRAEALALEHCREFGSRLGVLMVVPPDSEEVLQQPPGYPITSPLGYEN